MSGFARRLQQGVTPTQGGGGGTGTKPSPSNTGPRMAATGTYNGDWDTASQGIPAAGTHITGDLYVGRDNDTVSDVYVDGNIRISAIQGNYCYPVKQNQTVQYCKSTTGTFIGCQNCTFDHCYITGVSDGTLMQAASYSDSKGIEQCDGLTITNSYFAGWTPSSGGSVHMECLHLMGATNFLLQNTVFDATMPDQDDWSHTTAALTCEDAWQGVHCTGTVDGCYFAGGGYYTCYFRGALTIKNNKGTTITQPGGVQPAPQYTDSSTGSLTILSQSGNMWDGAPITFVSY
jgi:hypothetical protein